LYAASEVAGFAKTGGLADVAASLPLALTELGVDIAVIMPLYSVIRRKASIANAGLPFSVPVGERMVNGALWRGLLPHSSVPIYFIEQPDFFERDDAARGRGIYQHLDGNGRMLDYGDNCARFVFFSRAILEAVRLLDFWPEVLHVNDWHCALAPVYLREIYDRQANRDLRPRYQRLRTLLTIHNIAYQGIFSKDEMPVTGLPWRLFNFEHLEFHDHINFLKGGIVSAEIVNTVSPTYAREIQTPYFGCGLQGSLRMKRNPIQGVVNGVDYSVWNPAIDPHLASVYDAASLPTGKAICKAALQRCLGLAVQPHAPLMAMIARLVDQKGIDLLTPIVPALLDLGAQIVVLGNGDAKYQNALTRLQRSRPESMAVVLGADEDLAHAIEAGADMFLMPSRYEPCGLNQLFSLKYGTVPIVRATGGLADTVVDATPENLAAGNATGFVFRAQAAPAFLEVCERAIVMYRERQAEWAALQRIGMAQDWSWKRSAAEYVKLYVRLADWRT